MSAANSFNYSLLLTSRDQTESGIRSATQRVLALGRLAAKPITVPLKIAGGGLGLLRDINLGLRPLIQQIDGLVGRGAALETVGRSFARLSAGLGGDAAYLARQVVQASSGTLRLAEAMQVANRALGSGLSFKQLLTAVEFIGKKAITTGRDAGQAIDTVITGLSRGSTLFLDDFGILVDGADGVKRSFDAIKGTGAFDQLGPAAQKAETVRQATEEMADQLGRLGISGKEPAFIFGSLKAEIGNAVDKLGLAVAKSRSFQDGLRGVQEVVLGMVKHLEQGGSIGDLLFGKDKGTGLLDVAGTALTDAGKGIGSGIRDGILEGALALVEALERGWDSIATEAPGTIRKWGEEFAIGARAALFGGGKAGAGEGGLIGRVSGRLSAAAEWASGLFAGGPKVARVMPAASQPAGGIDIAGMGRAAVEGAPAVIAKDAAVHAAGIGIAAAARAVARDVAKQATGAVIQHTPIAGDAAAAALDTTLVGSAARGTAGFLAKRAAPALAIGTALWDVYKFSRELIGLRSALADVDDAQALEQRQRERLDLQRQGLPWNLHGIAIDPNRLMVEFSPQAESGFFLGLKSALRSALGGGGPIFGATRQAFGDFKAGLPPADGEKPPEDRFPGLFTSRKRRDLNRELQDLEREYRRVTGDSTGALHREATRNIDKRLQERLEKEGIRATPKEREAMIEEEFRRLQDEIANKIAKRLGELREVLGKDADRRNALVAPRDGAGPIDNMAGRGVGGAGLRAGGAGGDKLMQVIEKQIAAVNGLTAEMREGFNKLFVQLAGANQKFAAARNP